MDLDVIFLGTAGSVPSATRQTAATLIRRGGERILVDCGEGTQRRLLQSVAGLTPQQVELISFVCACLVVACCFCYITSLCRSGRATRTPGGSRARYEQCGNGVGNGRGRRGRGNGGRRGHAAYDEDEFSDEGSVF